MSNSAQFEIKIGVNSSGVTSGINSAVKWFNTLKAQIAGLGVGALIESAIQKTIEWGSSVNDTAGIIGTGVEKAQEYIYAAKQSGVEIETLAGSFRFLKKAQIEAIKGNEDATAAFLRNGISIEQLKKLTPEELFEKTGRAMAKLPASAQATADAMTLMGKSGDSVFYSFRDGFFEAADNARALGLVVEEDVIKNLDAAGDAVDRLKLKLTVGLAPAVSRLATAALRLFEMVQAIGSGAGAYVGSREAGMSHADSVKAANSAMQEDFQKSLEQDYADNAAAKAANKKAVYPNETGTAASKEKSNTVGKGEDKSSTDSLARIGGFRGGGEVANLQDRMAPHFQKIESLTEQLVKFQSENTKLLNKSISAQEDTNRVLTADA